MSCVNETNELCVIGNNMYLLRLQQIILEVFLQAVDHLVREVVAFYIVEAGGGESLKSKIKLNSSAVLLHNDKGNATLV